jgi:outer membrane lipoprotein-sorting protein
MHRFLSIFEILLFLLTESLYGLKIENISTHFERTIDDGSSRRITSGMIYYIANQRTLIFVDKPVEQRMLISGDTLLIYYPNENQAFRFIGENPFVMPMIYPFVGIYKDDYGLSESGYKIDSSIVRTDTLIIYWNMPKVGNIMPGKVIIARTKSSTAFIEIRDKNNKLQMRTEFREYHKYAGAYFPSLVLSEQYQGKGKVTETIRLENPEFGGALPESAIDFKIPDNLKIIESR